MNKAIQTLEFNICKSEICNQHKCSNMTQCGLFIPADESSQIPILDDVLVDIGDNQSIENAQNLYPNDYDLDTLFTDYSARKLEHDIKRGSKKALKKIQKAMRGK